MQNAHVHEILEMLNSSAEAYSALELQEAVERHFGLDTRFQSCSIDNMSAAQAVEFLINRGKFIPKQATTSCCGACGG